LSDPLFRAMFLFQAEDGIRHRNVTGVQTCALPIYKIPCNCIISGALAFKSFGCIAFCEFVASAILLKKSLSSLLFMSSLFFQLFCTLNKNHLYTILNFLRLMK